MLFLHKLCIIYVTFTSYFFAYNPISLIAFSTRDISTTGGVDYQTVTDSSVTFASGSDTEIGQINILNDPSREGPEMFEISIANPSNGVIGAIPRATVTIKDALETRKKYSFLCLCYYYI